MPGKNINEAILKALKDPSFKKKLMINPKKTLEEECQISLPENLSIQVLEESESKKYLVIPHVPQGSEITEDELRELVGGLGKQTMRICVISKPSPLFC